MKRATYISLARVAGYHEDHRMFTRLVVEARVARPVLNKAYDDGARWKAAGMPCGCGDCKAASAPPSP